MLKCFYEKTCGQQPSLHSLKACKPVGSSRNSILYITLHRSQSSRASHIKRYVLGSSGLPLRTQNFDQYGKKIYSQDYTPAAGPTCESIRKKGRANGRGRGRSTRSLTKSFLPPINPSPGDWLCPKCQCVNYRSRPHCINCGIFVQDDFPRWCNEDGSPWTLPPPFEPFPGDWRCGLCNVWNYKDHSTCARCQASMTDSCEYLPLATPAPNQFRCSECKILNYAHRRSCIKCDADRPVSVGPPLSLDRRKRLCVKCGFENSHSAECCLSCGHKDDRNYIIETGYSQQVCQGDWLCNECFYYNMSECQCCSRCRRPRGKAERIVNAAEAFSVMPGDWICSRCNVANYRFDTFCFLCGTSRGSDAMTIQYDTDPTIMKRQAVPFDWQCSICRRYVFAFNNQCPTCAMSEKGKSALLPAKQWEDAEVGDWRCDKCWNTTSFSRKRCFCCGELKSHHSQTLTVTVSGGNFFCRRCEQVNLSFRQECINCGAVRGYGNTSKHDNQKLCKVCNVFNFSWRTSCFYCHSAL